MTGTLNEAMKRHAATSREHPDWRPASFILEAGAQHLKDRAATYDKAGERSIPATVTAFNAITGHNLTAEQGWLLLALLKATRSQQGAYRADSYEDMAAYAALAGEQASKDRV